MKKLIKFILPAVIAVALGTTGIFIFKDNTEYYVDTTYFQSTYAYRSEVDLSGLKIVETENDEIKGEHQVDESMVVSCDSTSSTGEKTLVLQYDKEIFNVNFIVMYEIQFISDNQVVDLQYVLKASEIVVPKDPEKTGYEFRGWSPEIPNVINDNMKFEATFSDEPASIPGLGSYEATYGDTLADIELPTNQYGEWKFVDELTTPVGNVGTNKFKVKFVPTNTELKVVEDEIVITVAKKQLEFKNVVTIFDYDGLEHLPTYELEVEGINVVTMGTPGVEVGTYFIMYIIQDANYEGQWQGNFTIKASEISISFDKTELSDELGSTDAYYSIQLGENVPTNYAYTVNGIDNISLLQLKLNVEKVNHAGTYEVTIQVGNTSYKNVKITNKCYLIVEKTSLGAGLPTLTAQAIYGNKLSSVTFDDNNPNGYWVWENPDYSFDYVGNHIVNLVFTPYSSLDYSVEIIKVELSVIKRELEIKILNNIYTYEVDINGNAIDRLIEYKLYDGDEEIADIKVLGQISKSQCGKYETNLIVDDVNYSGSLLNVSLVINQATPNTNFDIEPFELIVGSTLGDIQKVPEGYAWKLPLSTKLDKVGLFEYDVIFTPEDTHNYLKVEGKLKVNVIKKEAEIAVEEEYNFVYGEQVKLNANFSHTESTAIYTYYLNDAIVAEITDAGTYTVVIKLPKSDNYNEATATTIVNIAKKEVELTWSNINTYSYQDKILEKPVVSFFNVNDVRIELNTLVYNSLTDELVDFKNAGTYYFVADTETLTNYVFTNTELVDIVIEKAQISLEEVVWNYSMPFVYDELEHKVEVINFHKALKPIYEENVYKDAGEYTASVTFEFDEDNYEVIGQVADCTWAIDKATVIVEWEALEVYTFNGELLAMPTATIKEGTIELNVIVEGEKEFKNAGTYTFVASIENENYDLFGNKLENIVVNKLSATVNWAIGEYTYTGLVLEMPTATIVDALGNTVELNVISLTGEFKNAGLYSFDAEFDETYEDASNYALVNTLSEKVEVLKADYNLNGMTWNYVAAFEFNGLEQKVELVNITEGLTPKYENNLEVNAGEYTASVTFEYDEVNYNEPIFTDLKWSIKAKVVNVEWDAEEVYVYTGSILNAPTATFKNVNNENVRLLVVEKDKKEFKEFGEYTFIASISDELDAKNYSLNNSTIKVSITKSTVNIDALNAVYGQTLNDVVLPLVEENGLVIGTWSFVDDLATSVGDAGANKFAVKFTSLSDNYDSYETMVTINVAKKVVVIFVEESEFTYDGSSKTLLVKVLDGEEELSDVDVLGNRSYYNAGTYEIELSINENNYQAEIVETELVIKKAEAIITNKMESNNSDYTGRVINIYEFFELNHNETTLDINVSSSNGIQEIKNAGTYIIEVMSYETDNYLASQILHVSYTINQISPELTYTAPEEGFKYHGLGTKIDSYVSHVNTDSEAFVSYSYKYLVDGNYEDRQSILAAGTYQVTAFIDDTTNFTEQTIEFEVVVEMGTFDVEKLDTIEAIYGQQLNEFKFEKVSGGSWGWENPNEYVGNVGTTTHKAIFISVDASYKQVELDVTFIVKPKPIEIKLGTTEFTYDGNEKTVTYSLDEMPQGVTTEVTGTISATNYKEGGYSFKIEVKGNENYTGYVEGVLVIKKADLELATPQLTAVYGQTLNDVVLPKADNGTWSFVDELTTSVGDAGTRNVAVKFTPTNTNYNVKTISAKLVVAKADYIPTVLPTTYTSVYGKQLSSVKLPEVKDENGDVIGTWEWDSKGTVGNAGVNTFDATFTPKNPNFNKYQVKDIAITVAKANSEITSTLPNKLTYTGSELIKQYFTLNHSEKELVFTMIVNGTSVVVDGIVNAGKYTVVVSVEDSNNYNGLTLASIEITVAKATPDTKFNKTFEYTYGKVLSNDDLSDLSTEIGEYRWKNLDKLEVGTHTNVAVEFIPFEDYKDNYETVNGYFTVVINRIEGTITANDEYQFTYTGTEFVLDVTTNNKDVNNVVTVDTKLLNAGEYTVKLSVDETAHYTAVEKTITVVINQKEETFELEDSYEFGITNEAIEKTLENTSEYGTFTVHETNPLQTTTYSVSYNSSNDDLTVETKKIWIMFTPKSDYAKNYAKYSKEVEITIIKKLLTFTDIQDEFTYEIDKETGKAIVRSVGYKLEGLPEGEEFIGKVEGNVFITDVNKSTDVKLVIVSDYYHGTWSGRLTIKKAMPKVNFDKKYDAFINGKLSDVKLDEGYSFTVDLNTPLTKDGSFPYAAMYTPEDTKNYETVTGYISVVVSKWVNTITIVNESNLNKVYDGNSLQLSASSLSGNPVTITYNGEEEFEIVNAGEYVLEFRADGNNLYQEGYRYITITIAKADPNPSYFNEELKGTWGQPLSSIGLNNGFTWKDGSKLIEFTDGEMVFYADVTYTPLTDEEKMNYNSVTKQMKIIVSKAKAQIEVNDIQEFTFGEDIDLCAIVLVNGKQVNVNIDIVATLNGNVATIYEPGKYIVTLSTKETEYYLPSENYEITVTINKIKVSVDETTTFIEIQEEYINHQNYFELLAGVRIKNDISGSFEILDNPTIMFPNTTDLIGTCDIYVKFKPTDIEHYETIESFKFTVKMPAVAYIGSIDSGKKYGTIESAVAAATSSDSIWVVKGITTTIRNNIDISSKLYIPYEDGKKGDKKATLTVTTIGELKTITTVIIGENVTVTLKESSLLEVGGELSGGGGAAEYSGHTAGKHSKIVLMNGAHLVSNGEINLYGFIEKDINYNISNGVNNPLVLKGGKLYLPFVLRDFRGGSYMYAIQKQTDTKHNIPFNEYEFRNITCPFTIEYNAKVYGLANLYAGGQQNATTVNYVGNDSSFFIQFTNSQYSYMVYDYNKDTEIAKIDIFGGAISNSLKLKVVIISFIAEFELDSADYFFPISWRINISLNKNKDQKEMANYSFLYKYKILPGGKVTINTGAHTEFGNIAIYDASWEDLTSGSWREKSLLYGYSSKQPLEDGQLIVNGSANFDTIGGKITSNNNGSKVTVKSNNKITTWEPKGPLSGENISAEYKEFQDYNYSFTLDVHCQNQIIEQNGKTNTTYYYKNNGWFASESTITYVDYDGTSSELIIMDKEGYDYSKLPVKTRNGYTFDGWYYDVSLTNKASTILGDITLYAKWIIKTYTINYYVTKDESIIEDIVIPDYTKIFDINTNINLGVPSHNTYIFDGWYYDEDMTLLINKYDYESLVNVSVDYVINLYAYWQNEIYTIHYDLTDNPNETTTDYNTVGVVGKNANEFIPQDLSNANYNASREWYLVGWYLESTYETLITRMPMAEFKQYLTGEQTEIILYAKWAKKVAVEINVGENAPIGYTINNGQTTITKFYMENDINSWSIIEDKQFESAKNEKTISHYFDGWIVGDLKDNKVIINGNWKNKIKLEINIGKNAPDEYTIKNGQRTITEYYMPEQLGEYVIDVNYASAVSNLNISYYFDDWYIGTEKFNGTLSESQVGDDGVITVTGEWIAKCKVTLNLSGNGASDASYQTWSVNKGAGDSSFYVVSGTTVTISGTRGWRQSIDFNLTNVSISSKSNTSASGFDTNRNYSFTFTVTQSCMIKMS